MEKKRVIKEDQEVAFKQCLESVNQKVLYYFYKAEEPKCYKDVSQELQISYDTLVTTINRDLLKGIKLNLAHKIGTVKYFTITSSGIFTIEKLYDNFVNNQNEQKKIEIISASEIQSLEQKDNNKELITKFLEEKIKLHTDSKERTSLFDKFSMNGLEGKNYLTIYFEDIVNFSPDLSEELLDNPDETLEQFKIVLAERAGNIKPDDVMVHILYLPKSQRIFIKNKRHDMINKFVSFEGQVESLSSVEPKVIEIIYKCPSCGAYIKIPQKEEKIIKPQQCSCGRRGRFDIHSKKVIDKCELLLTELNERVENNELQENIHCLAVRTLTRPDYRKRYPQTTRVRINGLLRSQPKKSKGGGELTDEIFHFDVNSIDFISEDNWDIQITKEDEVRILGKCKDIDSNFNLGLLGLIESFANSIKGHQRVKEAIICQMVCPQNKRIQATGEFIRNNSHILLIGDPGVAKSKLLKFVNIIV
ncbi:MAG: hypothetical protein WCW14_05185, partial [Candidatus Paceibacterota bacterium]